MKILIIDDSPHVHTQLRVFLSSAGYKDLLFAKSAKEALTLLKDKLDLGLILMDVQMKEVDGITAMKLIKAMEEYRNVPVLMVTADSCQATIGEALAAGATGYITKPIAKSEILDRLNSILKSED